VALKIAGKIEESMLDIKKRCNFSYEKNGAGKLKIGYVSPDFREHAVGILINEMFRFHDRERFEAFAYSLVDVVDEISSKIKTNVDSFVDISKVSPEVAARRINDDKIDILIDLAGYTTYSSPSIFALEPAPIQALFLGYPNSMGSDSIKYLLADRQIVDESLEPFYSEKIVYLPSAFLSSPMEISKKKKHRKEYGIPAEAFVFCCFSTSYKIEPNTFAVWMEIMNEVPESLLWVSRVSDDHSERMRKEAEKLGMSGDRLLFTAKEDMPDYLARMGLADLFLDTFIYSAGSTAVCSLYAGLPLLTLAGATNASRMGASICTASGLGELVCESEEAYKDRAIQLASDPNELKSIRNRLAKERETLSIFDTASFVQDLERGFLKLWEHHLSGQAPENITID
jgi:predicted O-linked N-acetylglucosamine transferase (SPINDLY family)